jgi:hemolysin activation/secretion protein
LYAALAAALLFLVGLAPVGGWCADAPPAAAPAPEPEQTFDIAEFRVLGNTVLPVTKVESAVYPFLGPKKTIHTVEQARDALIAAYKEGGFGTVLVDIPEQTVDDGIVRLKVTEGRIEKVRVSGARYYSGRRILSELPSIRPGIVPQFPQLQAQLAQLASEARDREITPVLKAGSAPGTVAVDLKVKDELPFHGSLEADNRYTADTTHTRVTANLSYANLFQRDEAISLQYQTSPAKTSEVKLWALTYSGRTASPYWTWSAYAIRSDSAVAALGTLDVFGNGRIFGGRLNRTLDVGGPGSVHTVTFGVDYKDFGQTVQLPGDVNAASPIHYLMWSGQYAFNHFGEQFQAVNSVAVNFGIRGIGGDDAEFQFKRSGATAGFSYLRGSTNLTWRLWRGISVSGKLAGQYSEQPLVNNEQFTLGGEDTVRGYLEAEELVDSGLAGTVELRAPTWTIGPLQTVFYTFYDRGIGMVQQPLFSEIISRTVRTDLYSWGAGLRLSGLHGFSGTFEWADPRVNGSRTLHGHGRPLFTVLYGF